MDTLGVINSVPRHRRFMKLDLQQNSSDDDSSPCCDVIAVDNLRRQSTASNISRHSSCPDLARNCDKAEMEYDVGNMADFETTADDISIDKQSQSRAVNTHKLNTVTRRLRKRLQSDHSIPETTDVFDGASSPSTPTSAHHVTGISITEHAPSNQTSDLPRMKFSPTSSCDISLNLATLNNRGYQPSSRCSIAGSVSDYPSIQADNGKIIEGVRETDDFNKIDGVAKNDYLTADSNKCVSNNNANSKLTTSERTSLKLRHDEHLSDNSNVKCQMWLQSLHITQERIKSRSYIHLPPQV